MKGFEARASRNRAHELARDPDRCLDGLRLAEAIASGRLLTLARDPDRCFNGPRLAEAIASGHLLLSHLYFSKIKRFLLKIICPCIWFLN